VCHAHSPRKAVYFRDYAKAVFGVVVAQDFRHRANAEGGAFEPTESTVAGQRRQALPFGSVISDISGIVVPNPAGSLSFVFL